MRIKVKRIDEPLFEDPIRAELEAWLNPSKEIPALEATNPTTPLMPISASATVDSQAMGNKQNIIKLLSEQHALRQFNRLIYTREKAEESQIHTPSLNVNLEVADKTAAAPYYKFADGTNFVEFAITYDNKIFFTSGEERDKKQLIQTYGTLLKAVGCMQLDKKVTIEGIDVTYAKLEEIVKYISVHNPSFTAHSDNIAVSLFVLKQLGLDLNATKVIVPNKSAKWAHEINPDCLITIRGEIKDANFYLDERRFPGAKAIASETKLTVLDKITELFHSIDDEILSKRSEKVIKEVELEKILLKLTIIKLIRRALFPKEEEETDLDEVLIQRKLQGENTANNQYVAINKIIHSFEESHIELSFLNQEILYLLSFKLQKGGLSEVEKEGLDRWIASVESIPARRFDLDDKSFQSWIRFYDENPIKTSIALLKDYSKGEGFFGMLMRILSGAWNRNYKDPVNKVLSIDKNQEFPDNMDMSYLFERLRESGLLFNPDASSKSRLRRILLFCAHLNGEREDLEQLMASSLVFFPPYPKPRFSFFSIGRYTSYGVQNQSTQVMDEIGSASHAEAMVDASAWATTDELESDLNMTQETSVNTTYDESFDPNEQAAQYEQSDPKKVAGSGSSGLNDPIIEKAKPESGAEKKIFTGQAGSSPRSRSGSFSNTGHSRSPSLYSVSAPSSQVDRVSPNEQQGTDNTDEPLCSESFRASL